MAEKLARFKPGANVPGFASAAQVLAGRFVKIVADKSVNGDYCVGHAGAGEWALGVAEQDSAVTTEPALSVERRINISRGGISRVLVGSGGLTAGGPVKSDSVGKAIAQGGSGVIVGYAMETASADEYAEIALV